MKLVPISTPHLVNKDNRHRHRLRRQKFKRVMESDSDAIERYAKHHGKTQPTLVSPKHPLDSTMSIVEDG